MSKPDAEIDTTRPEKWTDISKLAKRLELPHEADCFERAAEQRRVYGRGAHAVLVSVEIGLRSHCKPVRFGGGEALVYAACARALRAMLLDRLGEGEAGDVERALEDVDYYVACDAAGRLLTPRPAHHGAAHTRGARVALL